MERLESGRIKRMRTHTDQDEEYQDDIMVEEQQAESELFTELSEEQWKRIERGLEMSNMQLIFRMDELSVGVDGVYWSLSHFTPDIIKLFEERDVYFEDNTLEYFENKPRSRFGESSGRGRYQPTLVGRPQTKTRDLWTILKRGYVTIQGVTIWVQPAFTGKKMTNLSLNELEYQNRNEISPSQLVEMIQQWGGTDVLVVSHSFYMQRQQYWKAISCLRSPARTTPDIVYSFRLFFSSPAEVNAVYANYLEATRECVYRHGHPTDTAILRPVSNVDWNLDESVMYRPSDTDKKEREESRALIFGITSEISVRSLEVALADYELPTANIEIRKKSTCYAVVEFQSKAVARKAVARFGNTAPENLMVGNIVLNIKHMDSKPPPRTCFQCGQPGHYRNQCKRSQTSETPFSGGASTHSRGVPTQPSMTLAADHGEYRMASTTPDMTRTMESMMTHMMTTKFANVHADIERMSRRTAALEQHCTNLDNKMTAVSDALPGLEARLLCSIKQTMAEAFGEYGIRPNQSHARSDGEEAAKALRSKHPQNFPSGDQ